MGAYTRAVCEILRVNKIQLIDPSALIMLGFASFLLHQGLIGDNFVGNAGVGPREVTSSSLWKLGPGIISPYTLVYPIHSSFLGAVLLANIPQILLSISYFFYNSTLTSMMMAVEYDNYAIRGTRLSSNPKTAKNQAKKGLRVSTNRTGAQRSFYFLSLPYRYSLPLLLSYTVLHWLVSQSLFYVRVILYDENMQHDSNLDVNSCGWSPVALICAIIVGSVMILTLLGLSTRSFRSVIPLAGSCSAAISAACHPPDDDVDAAIKPIMWGEICSSANRSHSTSTLTSLLDAEQGEDDGDGGDLLEMQAINNKAQSAPVCTFTSCDIERPTPLQVHGLG